MRHFEVADLDAGEKRGFVGHSVHAILASCVRSFPHLLFTELEAELGYEVADLLEGQLDLRLIRLL